MKTSTSLTLLVFFALFMGACKSSESAMEAEAPVSVEQEMVNQYVAALGGREALRSIESMQATGQVEMPSVGMTMPLTITQKRPSKVHVRVDVAAMGAEVVNAYDGETAWQINPMQGGTQKMTGEQARTIKEQADIDGFLVDYAAKGYALEYVGAEEVKGASAEKLQVTRPDSSQFFVFLDAASFLQVKIEAEGTNPMTGAKTKVESYMGDYRDVGGVKMPFEIQVVMGGQTFQTVTLSDVKLNVEVDDTIFAYPKN